MSIWRRAELRTAFASQLSARYQAITAGATPIGWKLGFGSVTAMAGLGIDAPLIGYLLESGVLRNGGRAAVGGWMDPRIETEIAVHIDGDVPAAADRLRCRQAIGALSLAFELVDLVIDPVDPAEILARNVFQRHVVLGQRGLAGEPPLVTLQVGGRVVVSGADPTTVVGDIPELISHVASVAGELGPGLRNGDVVITGAVVPPQVLVPGEHYAARAPGLGAIELTAVS